MANKHMKRCSASLIIREMQIKTKWDWKKKKPKWDITSHWSELPSSKSLQTVNAGEGTLLHCWWECKLIQPLWKTVWRLLKKLGVKPPYDPAIPLLGIYLEETKIEKDTGIPLLIAALFTIAITWKQPRCSLTDEWIKKLWYLYTMEYYSAIKRNTFESVLMRWMNLAPIMHSEVSQKER